MQEKELTKAFNRLEEIDSSISSLTEERRKLTSEYHVELLEKDVTTVKYLLQVLAGLKTDKAIEFVEYHELTSVIEEVIDSIEEEIRSSKGVANIG